MPGQDVVIGSGGQMLQRFVQALHFAKKCKERERVSLRTGAWSARTGPKGEGSVWPMVSRPPSPSPMINTKHIWHD